MDGHEHARAEMDGRSSRMGGLLADLGKLARATGALIRDHAILAREEARQTGKRTAIDVSMGVVALPFALTALIMLSAALAVGLSRWLGVGWAFFVVGLLDLAIAGLLGLYAALRLRQARERTMALTREELERDRQMARNLFRRLAAPPPRAQLRPHEPLTRRAPGGEIHAAEPPADLP